MLCGKVLNLQSARVAVGPRKKPKDILQDIISSSSPPPKHNKKTSENNWSHEGMGIGIGTWKPGYKASNRLQQRMEEVSGI